jgi:AcrR family transcriptional regulator
MTTGVPSASKKNGKVERSRQRGPSHEKSALTRSKILAASIDVFANAGFEHARMSDIAKQADIAKGTLYIYFPTKEALFEAAFVDMVGGVIRSISAAEFDPAESVRAFILRVMKPALEGLNNPSRAGVFRVIILEGSRFPSLLETYRRNAFTPFSQAIRGLAQVALARGEIRSDALARLPLLMVAPGLAATIWNGLFPDEAINISEMFEGFVDLVFAGD